MVLRWMQLAIGTLAACLSSCEFAPQPWSDDEVDTLSSLSLESLPRLPADARNGVADNALAAELGRRLFFDTRFSANGAVSCATCHDPGRRFTDGQSQGVGVGTLARNTPSIVGSAYNPRPYWDGPYDSLWAQALAPFEDPNAHGSNRLTVVALAMDDREYRRMYRDLFGEVSDVDTMFANLGKAIAAFERTIMPTSSRFDSYVAAVAAGDEAAQRTLFSDDEIRGLRLFIGEAQCIRCHNGPLLTNYGIGTAEPLDEPGEPPRQERVAASLRNLAGTQPYGPLGELPTLADVLANYNAGASAATGQNEGGPLGLGRRELAQLEAFLATLDAPVTFRAGTL